VVTSFDAGRQNGAMIRATMNSHAMWRNTSLNDKVSVCRETMRGEFALREPQRVAGVGSDLRKTCGEIGHDIRRMATGFAEALADPCDLFACVDLPPCIDDRDTDGAAEIAHQVEQAVGVVQLGHRESRQGHDNARHDVDIDDRVPAECVGEPAADARSECPREYRHHAEDRRNHRALRLHLAVIAYAVGYESDSAFSAAFRRVMGCSPRQYARSRDLAAASFGENAAAAAIRFESIAD